LTFEEDRLVVEGADVPEDTPFVSVLRDRLKLHDIARVHLAHGASTVDLVELLRGLGTAPASSRPARAVAERLAAAHVVSVSIISREQAAGAGAQRHGPAWLQSDADAAGQAATGGGGASAKAGGRRRRWWTPQTTQIRRHRPG
jgi:hypothetical protein